MRVVLPLLAAAGLLGTVHAADPDTGYWDLRLNIGSYAPLEDSSYESDFGSIADSTWDTTTGAVDIVAVRRFASGSRHGGYITFGISSRSSQGDEEDLVDVEVEHSAFAFLVGGGYSFWAGPVYSLELGARFGLGFAEAEEKDPVDTVESETGGYVSFDLQVVNIFNLTRLFQLNLTIGLAAWASAVTYDEVEVDASYSGSGAYISIGAGLRL